MDDCKHNWCGVHYYQGLGCKEAVFMKALFVCSECGAAKRIKTDWKWDWSDPLADIKARLDKLEAK